MTKETKQIGFPADGSEWETLFAEDTIRQRVQGLGKEISEVYREEKLLIIGVLRGAFVFTADIIREVSENLPDVEVDFLTVSSYGDGEESNRKPVIENDLKTDIKDLNVLLVEDIVETGHSFNKLIQTLQARNPKTLRTCALISKPVKREIQVPIDFLGFAIEDRWVEGYGLDTGQRGRGRKDIIAKVIPRIDTN